MNILLFPGSDALEDPRLRRLALRIPEVRLELNAAQETLDQMKIRLHLKSFMDSENELNAQWFQHLAVATLPVQVGLFKHFVASGATPGAMLSCSLGDVARNVCIGAVSMADSLRVMFKFVSTMTTIQNTALLRCSSLTDVVPHDLFLQEFGVELSIMQTPRHFLVGGRVDHLQKWVKSVAREKKYRTAPLYPYALHTSEMNPVRDAIRPDVESANIQAWVSPVFSAVSGKWLNTATDLRVDLLDNVVKTVNWKKSLELLSVEGRSLTFVNLGPAPTLVKFHQKTLGLNIPIVDHFFEQTRDPDLEVSA